TAASSADPASYPARIDFPAPSVDLGTGVITTNFSPEGMAISGDTFYAGSTATGEIIKGNLKTGNYQRNWVPASPAQPSELQLGPGGALPAGDVPAPANQVTNPVTGATGNQGAVCPSPTATPPVAENLGPVNPAMIRRPTPGFISSDGVDTLPNGHVLFASVSGKPVPGGQMINMDPVTGTFTYINVTSEAGRNAALPPLLSL